MNRSNAFFSRLLVAAPIFAAAALALGAIGLYQASAYEFSFHGFSRLLFEAVAHLAFQPPQGHEAFKSWAFSLARVFVVLFAATTAIGLVLALSRTANDLRLRFTFWLARTFGNRRPSVVVGLGSVLSPLVRELRLKGPVYAIDIRPEGPGVDDAREQGALVITGDAIDPSIRARADVGNAGEIFVATGDDMRNLGIAAGFAADAAAAASGRSAEEVLHVYVHTRETTRSATMEGYGLLAGRSEGLHVIPFSSSDLAARELFFDPVHGLVPGYHTAAGPTDVFHLLVFGFGATGQAVALHVSRFAHFPSRLRPRLTIYSDPEPLGEQQREFLQRYPVFTAADLDLSSEAFLKIGDGWDARPGRPAAREYERDARAQVAEHAGPRSVRPIEYSVNAEFRSLSSDPEPDRLSADLERRIRPASGPRVHAAAVICFEDSRTNFRTAVRLRDALARRFLDDAVAEGSASAEPTLLPIHVYLPDESNLAALLRDSQAAASHALTARAFPFRVFGQARERTSYGAITRGPLRGPAEGIDASYAILSERGASDHPDFDESNLDAALHAERIKIPAMGLVFLRTSRLDPGDAERLGVHATPLLHDLFDHDAVQAADRLLKTGKIAEDGRLDVSLEQLQALPGVVRQRLAILDQIHVPVPVANEAPTRRVAIRDIVYESVQQVVQQLERELRLSGRDLDMAAAMEHHRWMGERFVKGWSFGMRSDVRRRRASFVPWDDLSEFDRNIDRAQFARLIVGRSNAGEYAFVRRGSAA